MNEDKGQLHKVDYVKPEVLDLGAVTPAFGGHCGAGGTYTTNCTGGGSPEDACNTGESATGCGGGNSPAT